VIVPPRSGYGQVGFPGEIKPTDTVVFVVDVLGAHS
jgi:FKBP-type peptidyl-prolyl cis-trans isomerase